MVDDYSTLAVSKGSSIDGNSATTESDQGGAVSSRCRRRRLAHGR